MTDLKWNLISNLLSEFSAFVQRKTFSVFKVFVKWTCENGELKWFRFKECRNNILNIYVEKVLPLGSSSSMVVELSVDAFGSLEESPLEPFTIDLAKNKENYIKFY